MTDLDVRDLVAGYTADDVLRGVTLHVPSGSLVALLGPSGCGKTTLLRVVAGFHPARAGRVSLGDIVVDDAESRVPTHRRRVSVVPQEGALFPHLDVTANVAFGLQGTPDATDRVEEMLALVGLLDERRRFPHQLSGGQQQRVALARALAPRPDLVLLDEPFSSLDAQLREQLRADVRELLVAQKATALLVTHDQQEALALADEIAVMHDGLVRQQAPPDVVYARPTDRWTAQFLGDAVVLDVLGTSPEARVQTVLGDVEAHGRPGPLVLLRPEQLRLGTDGGGADGGGADGVRATVVRRQFHGHDSLVLARIVDGSEVLVRTVGVAPDPGQDVRIRVAGPGWYLRG